MRGAHWISSAVLFLALLEATGGLSAAQRRPPKRPERPFSVYVCAITPTSPEEHAQLAAATETVKKRIRKRKKWLRLVSGREGAEIIVELVRHAVNKQHVNELSSRVNATGTSKEWVDVNYLREHHFIEARVTILERQQIFTGADQRDRGGSAKRAADDLAKQIEAYCKDNYWSLLEARPAVEPQKKKGTDPNPDSTPAAHPSVCREASRTSSAAFGTKPL